MNKTLSWCGTVLLLLLLSPAAHAQYLRSAYFIEGSNARTQLNPALQPQRSYFILPVIGSLATEVSSNSLGIKDVTDLFDSGNNFYNEDKFYNNLKSFNHLNVNINTSIISFGIKNGKGFWSFNLSARGSVEASISKSMFDYLRAIDNEDYNWKNGQSIDIENNRLQMNYYTEIGAGYSRMINQRLTIGGKIKLLLGMGDLNMKINKLHVYGKEDGINSEYQFQSDAELNTSAKGLEMEENEKGYVNDLDYNSYGISGYGTGIDLGASYKLLDNAILSASLTDLGFISWTKGNTQTATSTNDIIINKDNYDKSPDIFDMDLYGLKKQESKSRSTSLSPTLTVAGEYDLFQRKLGLGLLSTNRFGKINTYSELTLSATYRPNDIINACLSYSMLNEGKTWGMAIKAGPLLIGTDYLYLGENSKHVNAFIGMSFTLGKKNRN